MTPKIADLEIAAANRKAALRCGDAGIATRIVRPDGSPIGNRSDATTRGDVLGSTLKLDATAMPVIELSTARLLAIEVAAPAVDDFQRLVDRYGTVVPSTDAADMRIYYFRRPDRDVLGDAALPAGIALRTDRTPAPGAATATGSWQASQKGGDLISALKANLVPELPQWLVAYLRGEPMPAPAAKVAGPVVVVAVPVPAVPARPSCAGCTFFDAPRQAGAPGRCRKPAPLAGLSRDGSRTMESSMWIEVRPTDFCGEFTPGPPQKTACATCRFFDATRPGAVGKCHRGLPSPTIDNAGRVVSAGAQWPGVRPDDRCGEWAG